jgi:cysteine synthase A
LLEAYGAEVVLTDPEGQMEGAIARAQEIAAATPGSFVPHQFENPMNPKVHAETTAAEILHALAGDPMSAFVAAVGTGGTISGVGRILKALSPPPRVIAVEPEATAVISGGKRGPSKIQGIGPGFLPKNYDPSVVDEVRTIADRAAYDTKVALARQEGLLVGISAGANVRIALDIARELGPESLVVTVLCDTGERYFSLDEFFVGTP